MIKNSYSNHIILSNLGQNIGSPLGVLKQRAYELFDLVGAEGVSKRSFAVQPSVSDVLQTGHQHQHHLLQFGPFSHTFQQLHVGAQAFVRADTGTTTAALWWRECEQLGGFLRDDLEEGVQLYRVVGGDVL